MPELLLEIGCEEVPARFMPEALSQLKERAEDIFSRERISFKSLKSFGTPRRLVLLVEELSSVQANKPIEKWGPFVNQAFDSEGRPTKSALGFAKSMGVEVGELQKKMSEKGERLYFGTEEKGKKTEQLLKTLVPELILGLSFSKSMRWSTGKIRFARPIHWILARFNGKVIKFELDGIKSNGKSYGHRFLAPERIEVKDFRQYLEKLAKAYVMVDQEERKQLVRIELEKTAKKLGGELVPDEGLIEEVSFLVEYPMVLSGSFEPNFLKLPPSVLISAMRGHQRYFAVKKKGERLELLPNFLFVANTRVKDKRVVIKGNEKVLSARLNDAEFFYKEDLKIPLSERSERLGRMVFQAGLGSYLDKRERLEKLLLHLIEQLGLKDAELKEEALRAVRLCKADLLTQMVGEFPDLEGVMAGEYARVQGEPDRVWKAVSEHYLPKTAQDIDAKRFPKSLLGQILSIADKTDSIIAGFVSGNQPTGSQDPFGIRRLANGLIQTTLKYKIDFNLDKMIELGLNLFSNLAKFDSAKIKSQIIDFFQVRLKNILSEFNFAYDIINAVVSSWEGSIISVWDRVLAISELRKEPDFQDLFIGFRRVERIIEETGELEISLFENDEKRLWESFQSVKSELERFVLEKKWKQALLELAKLKPEIDRFFDKVLVNVEDERIRKNRHTLLDRIAQQFRRIADFSQIVGGDKNKEGG